MTMDMRKRVRTPIAAAILVLAILGVAAAQVHAGPKGAPAPGTECGQASQSDGAVTYYRPGAAIVVDVNGHPVTLRCGDDVRWHLDARSGGSFTSSSRVVSPPTTTRG
jgi:hypothetical protein